ncbi:MAG: TlpA family protein disulfide reductase [Bryobacterales bacterium]|nr:TlpA family protein disulfide reductase [Bryobacterales bacterium]
MRIRQYLNLAVAAVLVLCLVACSKSSKSPAGVNLKDEQTRNEAADFALEDSNGQKLTLSSLRGKVVLLNFWATWCGPCRIEIPWFIEMEREFKDQGFAVVGVSMDQDGWSAVKPFMEEMKINYRVVLGTEEAAQLYGGVEALPTSYILDRNGKVAAVHMGIVRRQVFEEEIRALLDSKAASTGDASGSTLPIDMAALRSE